MIAILNKLFNGRSAKAAKAVARRARPRRAGLGVEALEERLVLSGNSGWGDPPSNPWSYTVPSGHGSDTIVVSVANNQLQVLDNGAPAPGTPLFLTGITSITLTGGTTTTNTFDIQSTPAGIPVSVKFATPADSAVVGYAGSVQGIRGSVGFTGYNGAGAVTVDDSADATTHSASLFNGTLSGLAPASVFINNLSSLVMKAAPSAGDSIWMTNSRTSANTFTGAPGKSTLSGGGCSLEVDNFAKVHATGQTTGDSATLNGSAAGANTFTARYAATTLAGPGYSLEVDYFGHATAYSATSRDVATINGLSGYCNVCYGGVGASPDCFLYSIASTSLSATQSAFWSPISSYAYYRDAEGFKGMTVNAGSSNDYATLNADYYAPCGFVGLLNSTFLCSSGGAIQVNSFSQVVAYGNPSSSALMVSTPGDSSSYNVNPQSGSWMTGPGGVLVEATGFGGYNHNAYSDLASEAQALNTVLTSLASQYALPGTYSLTLTQPGNPTVQTVVW